MSRGATISDLMVKRVVHINLPDAERSALSEVNLPPTAIVRKSTWMTVWRFVFEAFMRVRGKA